jgi:serine/threonine protein kinase
MSSNSDSIIQKYEYQANELLLNRYRIVRRIGQGGMHSIVYLAEDTTVKDGEYFSDKNKYVAIKIINRVDDIADDE